MSSLKNAKRLKINRRQLRSQSDAIKQEAARIELKSTVAQQQKAMELLATRLREQAAQIQRVSSQFAAASPSRGGLELKKFAKGGICPW